MDIWSTGPSRYSNTGPTGMSFTGSTGPSFTGSTGPTGPVNNLDITFIQDAQMFTVPPGFKWATIKAVGGGGGGGGGTGISVGPGGGGGSGFSKTYTFPVTGGDQFSFVIGSGGAPSTDGQQTEVYLVGTQSGQPILTALGGKRGTVVTDSYDNGGKGGDGDFGGGGGSAGQVLI